MSNESKCPGHNRAECVSCCWPRRDTDSQWTPAEQEALALGEKSVAPLELNKIGAGYTAVDMTTAAAQGFRDGAASVMVELPPVMTEPEKGWNERSVSIAVAKMQGFNRAIREVKKALKAQGISVKQ